MKRPLRTLSLFFVILLSTLSAAGCVQVPISGQWDFGVKELRVFKKTRVGQDFYVSDRNLTRIDVFLYPSKARRAKMSARERRKVSSALKGKQVTLKLYSLPERRRVIKMDLAVNKIKAARMYAFTFKPLPDSKHRRYYFELEAPDLGRESAVAVRATTLDRYKEGSAFSGAEPMPSADLGFQTYIDMTAIILVHSIAARLAADVPFMAVWGFLVLITAAAALREWWPRSGLKSRT